MKEIFDVSITEAEDIIRVLSIECADSRSDYKALAVSTWLQLYLERRSADIPKTMCHFSEQKLISGLDVKQGLDVYLKVLADMDFPKAPGFTGDVLSYLVKDEIVRYHLHVALMCGSFCACGIFTFLDFISLNWRHMFVLLQLAFHRRGMHRGVRHPTRVLARGHLCSRAAGAQVRCGMHKCIVLLRRASLR